uniref:CHK domain-containing protein n=1 Tax=Glossina brevipalpis TaxID=37001 RepID=A0A1A9WZ77_9MUSC
MLIKYDENVLQRPDYLSVDFFQEVTEYVLRSPSPDIKNIDITMASKTGDNYCSLIYRIKILYRDCKDSKESEQLKTISLIIKSMPISKPIDFLLDMKVFLKEKIFYNLMLPLMEFLLDDQRKFGARLYHCSKNPINTLVFEDLNTLGYRIASREDGFDETHAQLILKRLAEFHAISIIINKKDPMIMKSFNTGLLAKDALEREGNSFFKLIQFTFNALIELTKTIKGYEHITRKLEKYAINLRSRIIECQMPQTDDYQVLNHGDMWVNNLMFNYNEQGKPNDMIFVDYQMSIWGSPGIDLNYFFYTSLPLEMLKSKLKDLSLIYHQNLVATLNRFNYNEIPTYEQIQNEIHKRAAYGFFANHTIYPLISMDKSLSIDCTFENLAHEQFAIKKFQKVFNTPRLKAMYSYTLKQFDEMKVFD